MAFGLLRVLGALMISDPPEMSSGGLGGSLDASRDRCARRRGERGDFPRLRPGVWDGEMRRDSEANGVFLRKIARCFGLPDSDGPAARRSPEEMAGFYREQDLPGVPGRKRKGRGVRDG